MENYRLIYVPGGNGSVQPTEIPSGSASGALLLAQRHSGGRPVEIWRGDQLLCRVAESAVGGFWEIT